MTDSPTADWWCWTVNEPSTFRCRELGHDVRPQRPHPIEAASADLAAALDAVGPPSSDDLSISERLRQTQGALAASQADLTRVELELTKARMANEALHAAAGQVAADLTEAERQREDLRRRLNLQSENWIEARNERDLARAELASALTELEQLRAQLPTPLHIEEPPA